MPRKLCSKSRRRFDMRGLIVLLLLAGNTFGQTTVWRPNVRPGEWSYIWNYDGGMDGAHPNRGLKHWGTGTWWDSHFQMSIEVPNVVGPWPIVIGGKTVAVLNVLPPAGARRMVVLYPGSDAGMLEEACSRGDVTLLPGLYNFGRNVRLRNTVYGYGAVVVGGINGSYRNAMFTPTDGCSLVGLSLRPKEWLFTGNGAENVTVRDCEIKGGSFGQYGNCPGLLVEDCRFIRAGASPVLGGMWLNCRFDGGAPEHSFLCEGGNGPLALICCTFDSTDRGPIFRNGWGPVKGLLISCLELRSINKTTNGNELINFEGNPTKPGLEKGLLFHFKSQQCDGEINFYNLPVNGLRMWDIVCDGGVSISSTDGAIQTGIEGNDWQLGRYVYFGPKASNNTLTRCWVVPTLRRNNQGWQDPAVLIPRVGYISDGVGNTVADSIPATSTGVTRR